MFCQKWASILIERKCCFHFWITIRRTAVLSCLVTRAFSSFPRSGMKLPFSPSLLPLFTPTHPCCAPPFPSTCAAFTINSRLCVITCPVRVLRGMFTLFSVYLVYFMILYLQWTCCTNWTLCHEQCRRCSQCLNKDFLLDLTVAVYWLKTVSVPSVFKSSDDGNRNAIWEGAAL